MEETKEKTLEQLKNEIEAEVGRKMPKGICICELENGNIGFIRTGDVDEDDYEDFRLAWYLRGLPTTARSDGETRAMCTGDYIKIE